jgi:hypothetical protein
MVAVWLLSLAAAILAVSTVARRLASRAPEPVSSGLQVAHLGTSGSPIAVPSDEVPTEMFLQIYEQAVALDPKNLDLRRKYARYCLEKKLSCAKPQFKLLLESDPTDSEARRVVEGP